MKQPINPDPSNSPHFCLFPFSCNGDVSPRSSMDFETAEKEEEKETMLSNLLQLSNSHTIAKTQS